MAPGGGRNVEGQVLPRLPERAAEGHQKRVKSIFIILKFLFLFYNETLYINLQCGKEY